MAAPRRGAGPRPWGWHRLDQRWADQLVDTAGIPPRAVVLDVGAGDGAITEALLRRGLEVIAVELHPERVRRLRERFRGRVTVVRADAGGLRLPRRPFHVVANPPFAIGSPLLRRLVSSGSRLQTAHVVLQRQAARRWASIDAPAARRWRSRFTVGLGPSLPRRAFTPPPTVDVRVLRIRRIR